VLSGDVGSGVPMLAGVVAKDPARYDAQLLLGHHFHETQRWPETIAALEAYFAHRPPTLATEDARHRVDLADAYLRSRQPQKALALFQQSAGERKQDLRARLGVAWATAAIDCRRARPLLRDLEPVAEQHPEVWLVDGQCALALGDTNAALSLGRRYLDRSTEATAAGHALVGEAQATRGNLVEAKKELFAARGLEPARRRWTVRLAYVLRKSSEPKEALLALDKLGAPAQPAVDPGWWIEVGEALLATGDAAGAVARLTPVLPDLPRDAEFLTVVGAANLQTNQAEPAIKLLDAAEAIAPSPRARKLLVEALTSVGVARLTANDAPGAEILLARASELDPNAIVLRDLGIALLAQNKSAAAMLDRAVKIDGSAVTLMLDARAHAVANDIAGARPLYERALVADKANPLEISIDWAASELAAGDPAIAVTALEKTTGAAKTGPLAQRHKTALADARHAAGLAALRQGNGARAVELLRAASSDGTLATKCDLALAEVAAGDNNAALVELGKVSGQSCPFPAPADTQAAPILIAFTEGLNPRRAGKALDKLTSLTAKATGAAASLLATAIRVVALNAAQDAYHAGQLAQARKYLATARAANARIGNDEIAHNLAVLDLADGKVDLAIVELERESGKLPEALVNLGIAYERKNEPAKALDAWRRARKAGARFAPLAEWIDAKERIYGDTTP
jgi:tetratricopeptide (TPR) repeat protein